jgi:hypothetical protein
MYVREVYAGVPGYILFSCGTAVQHLGAWSIETGSIRRIGRPGAKMSRITDKYICTVNEDEYEYYDLKTFGRIDPGDPRVREETEKWREHFENAGLRVEKSIPSGSRFVVGLADGSIAGIRGQEYFIIDGKSGELELGRIPAEAPATTILTITADERGNIWGSSAFGQTIFSYNPADNSYTNTPSVCESGGEVYGMQFCGGKLFMSSYAGGDHVVYDPMKPWDQINNINPVTLKSLAPDFIRPTGRSTVGPDGAFWTGWSAKYGVYGGSLSRVDTGTLEVQSWPDPVPEQQIAWLAADDRYLYFTTNGEASGRKTKVEGFHFVVWDPFEGKSVKDITLPVGVIPRVVVPAGNHVFVAAGEEIPVFDKSEMRLAGTIQVSGNCDMLAAMPDNRVLAFCGTKLFSLLMPASEADYLGTLPGPVLSVAVTPSGDVYFVNKEHLYRFL